jgi:hypothetical protein
MADASGGKEHGTGVLLAIARDQMRDSAKIRYRSWLERHHASPLS